MTNPLADTAFLESLRRIVGAMHVLTTGDLVAWEQDWRRRVRGKALAVVRPGTTTEVAAVIEACARASVAVVPQGGNTGLVAGSTPDQSGSQIVLSLTRMDAVREIDAANLTVTVEAGCILQVLQEKAEGAGFLFPLSLAAEGSCTVGGILATNAGGTQVLRYGNARDLCLGLELVNAQGEVWSDLAGLRKDNTGYDLRNLFIGSEGTLGVITAATMKLYPMPMATLTAWASVPSLAHAVELLSLARRHLGVGMTGFEVMGKFALSLVGKHFPQLRVPFLDDASATYCVLLEHADSASEAHGRLQFEGLLEVAFEEGYVTDAVVAENLAQAHQLWHLRESIPLAQAEEGLNIKHDISVPISLIPEFVDMTDRLLKQAIPDVRLVNFGHLGDGNLHYNVQAPADCDHAHFSGQCEEQVKDLVYRSVAAFNGSFSAEHGVGELKLHELQKYKSPIALKMMRSVKCALDPLNLMNPGRVLQI